MKHTPYTPSGNGTPGLRKASMETAWGTGAVQANPQKQRTGLNRLWHAGMYSLQGLHAAWQERAFRLEAWLALVLLPAAWWLGRTWLETLALAGTVVLVLIVELLNSAVETVVDRVGLQWHSLSKKAKDLGSAAVFLALLLCAAAWTAALVQRLG